MYITVLSFIFIIEKEGRHLSSLHWGPVTFSRNVITRMAVTSEQMESPLIIVLSLIDSLKEELEEVEINCHQCRRLVDRVVSIGEALQGYESYLRGAVVTNIEYLIKVLKRAQSILIQCGGKEWVTKALYRATYDIAFRDIHREITKFKIAKLSMTGSKSAEGSIHPEILSNEPTANDLKEDAKCDLMEILEKLEKLRCALADSPNPDQPAEHLEAIIRVISEKFNDSIEGEKSISASYLQIDPSGITRVKILGTGAYGDVHEVKWLGCTMCLKDFPWVGGYGREWFNEALPLIKLRHQNVSELVGFSPSINKIEDSKVLIEMMQCDIRCLIDLRMNEGNGEGAPFSQSVAVDIMTQVARGLNCLHKHKFMHGDRVLTTNILATEYGDYVEAKIGDFGVPQHLPVQHKTVYEPRLNNPTGSETARWMAPEVWSPEFGRTGLHSAQSDIYSFGMLSYELLTGNRPFDHYTSMAPVHSQVVAGERPELPKDLNSKLDYLIRECWHTQPSSRPTADNLLEMLEDIQISGVAS